MVLTLHLSWPLECIVDPGHNRKPLVHNFLDLKPALVGHDDEIIINTQTSSQWDGLRKLSLQPRIMLNTLTSVRPCRSLGFSRDGAVLQRLDPRRDQRSEPEFAEWHPR